MDNLTYEKSLIAKAARTHTPINGSLELLPLCNMNCEMCYVRLSRSELERKGRLRSAAEWISLVRQMQKAGTLFLLLTGGEPLLFPDFKTLYLELRNMGMILTINTNGTLIDEAWADFFAANPPRRINITLYGTSKDTYRDLCHYEAGFEKVLHGIRLLRERNIDVKINGSLVRSNDGDVDSLVSLAHLLDAPINIDTYMYPATRERSRPFSEQARLLPEDAAKGKIQFEKASLDPESYLQLARTTLSRVAETPDLPDETFQIMRCQAGRTSFTVNWQGKLHDISFQLHKGEILGLGGLTECGMHELCKVVFGDIKPDSGEVILTKDNYKVKNTTGAISHRMAYLPKDRDTESLFLMSSIKDNITVTSFDDIKKGPFIPKKAECTLANKAAEELAVKMQSVDQKARELSGGNKQKVVVAKWLANDSQILIMDCPTRGIDIGVKATIYHLMEKLISEGKSIIMVSEEIPELLGMSDRILIMKDGVLNGQFLRDDNVTESMLIEKVI